MQLQFCIIKPLNTEKSYKEHALGKSRCYVHPDANKITIKSDVEQAYKVSVKSVRTMPDREKIRMISKSKKITKRKEAVIAIVTLKEGTIDIGKIYEPVASSKDSKAKKTELKDEKKKLKSNADKTEVSDKTKNTDKAEKAKTKTKSN